MYQVRQLYQVCQVQLGQSAVAFVRQSTCEALSNDPHPNLEED
jgi:hypothetical protein